MAVGIARWSHRTAVVGAALTALMVALGVAGMLAGAPAASRERFPAFRGLYERFMPFLPPRF
jgi:hypothetical protein